MISNKIKHLAQPTVCIFFPRCCDWISFMLSELTRGPEEVFSVNQVKPTDADFLSRGLAEVSTAAALGQAARSEFTLSLLPFVSLLAGGMQFTKYRGNAFDMGILINSHCFLPFSFQCFFALSIHLFILHWLHLKVKLDRFACENFQCHLSSETTDRN